MPALSDCFLCRAINGAIDCYTRTPKRFRLGLLMVADPNTMCYHLKCRSFETFKCFTQYSKAVNRYSSHPILVPSPLPRSIGYTGRHYIGRCRCSQGTGRPHYGRNHCGRDRLARFIGWWLRKGWWLRLWLQWGWWRWSWFRCRKRIRRCFLLLRWGWWRRRGCSASEMRRCPFLYVYDLGDILCGHVPIETWGKQTLLNLKEV